MPSNDLQRLSTFAQWPIPTIVHTGISMFVFKAVAAHFERSADCLDDEVVCKSCAVQFCEWSTVLPATDSKFCEFPAAVHRVISPRCPALNLHYENDALISEDMRNLMSLMDSPYARYIPSQVMARSITPEQSPSPASFQRATRAQRMLFQDSPEHQHEQEEGNCTNSPESEIYDCAVTISNPVSQPSVLDQKPITHPFRPKTGDFDHLFASHRLKTYPGQHISSCPKYQKYAEEGFVFRRDHNDVMCVYCGTVLSLNGHQPGAVHRKVCLACPFVMGFDVGNISQEQEKCIRLTYYRQQAARKHHSDFEVGIRFMQYQNEEDRLGTFHGWPKMCAKIFPASVMASAGFFYSGCSDKVVCFTCGVELFDWNEDADIWTTHATVSPTCQHVINTKGQDFIAQATNMQVLAEVKYPKVSSAGESSSSGGMLDEEPGSAVPDMTAIKAALACRYPNEAILKASLKAADENHIIICKQQQLVQQKETQLQRLAEDKDIQLQRLAEDKDIQLQRLAEDKDTQLQQKDKQLQRLAEDKDTQLQRLAEDKDKQLQEEQQTVQILQRQLNETVDHLNVKEEQLSQKEEQLSQKEEQLSQKEEQLRLQERQIQSLMQQVHRLRVNYQHRPAIAQDRHHSLVCQICMSDKPRMIFLPCGHLFSCAECTSRLPDRRCPVCRQHISDVLPAFVV